MQRRIGIIEAGLVREGLRERHGDYPQMVERMLQNAGGDFSFATVSPARGEPLGDPGAFDGVVITGSRHGVNDTLPWIEPLKDYIRVAAARGIPQVGICFGHQIAAAAFGGRVDRNPGGWGCGLQPYTLQAPADHPLGTVNVPVFHQDQVLVAPPGATTIARNAFCRYGGFRYREPVISVQFHPEFTIDYVADLLRANRGGSVPDDTADLAERSLVKPAETGPVARWMAAFLTDPGRS